MYTQTKTLKEGGSVMKPIYNHVSGLLDPAEKIESPKILVRRPPRPRAAPALRRMGCSAPWGEPRGRLGLILITAVLLAAAAPPGFLETSIADSPRPQILEGLHPFYDERVRALFDFKLYLDISDEVKFAWKIQRDMAERGHSLESIKASIEARKPDFDAYIDPQKAHADVIIQVLPTQLIPDDNEGKVLRVRMIQKEGVKFFNPVYLFDEGSTISWIPCGRKLTCSYPGIKFFYGPDTYYGEEVSVLEMDGSFDKLEELIYVESHLSNTSTKFYGEVTQQMLKYSDFPGSSNGTGLFQTLCGLKIRELYEQLTNTTVTVA